MRSRFGRETGVVLERLRVRATIEGGTAAHDGQPVFFAGEVQINRLGTTGQKTEFPYGSIAVTSDPPGLAVSLDGMPAGKTPATLNEIKPESHKLTVSDGENDLSAEFVLAPKEQAKQPFVFRYGAAQLTSTPPGATVLLNGKEIGVTPLTLNHLVVGTPRTVDFRLLGYSSDGAHPLGISEGKTTQFTETLLNDAFTSAIADAKKSLASGALGEAEAAIKTALNIEPKDSAALALQVEIQKAGAAAAATAKQQRLESLLKRSLVSQVGPEQAGTDLARIVRIVPVTMLFNKSYQQVLAAIVEESKWGLFRNAPVFDEGQGWLFTTPRPDGGGYTDSTLTISIAKYNYHVVMLTKIGAAVEVQTVTLFFNRRDRAANYEASAPLSRQLSNDPRSAQESQSFLDAIKKRLDGN
jgi:hypothetical protein